jgi:predicted helicase
MNDDLFRFSHYRPFFKLYFYAEKKLSDRLTSNHYSIFGKHLNKVNKQICFMANEQTPLIFLAVNTLTDLNFCARGGFCVPLFTYEKEKPKINITDWGLNQFTEHYQDETITKEEVFYYTYAVIHNPNYREKYKQNLKREFPRLPFYTDFRKWSNMGKELMDLHIDYETADNYELIIMNYELKDNPKPKLKALKNKGTIILDENTTISNLPNEVWEYKLGNRSAIEWILNQYQETTYNKKAIETYPDKKTLHENFNHYKFADFKHHVIDLIKRLTTVSVKTVEIMNEMKKIKTP